MKKKHRKKTRSTKRAKPRKGARRTKAVKRRVSESAGAHAGQRVAKKRRRKSIAGRGAEHDGLRQVGHPRAHHRAEAHGSQRSFEKMRRRAHSHGRHQSEPEITEKSFDNLLAFRRFQNHTR